MKHSKLNVLLSISICAVFAHVFVLPSIAQDSMAEAFADQGKRCLERGQVWEAVKQFEKALAEESKVENKDENDELYIARLYNDLGECYRRLAADAAQRAKIDDPTLQGSNKKVWLDKAEEKLRQSLEIKEARSHSRTDFLYIARGLENLARVYSDLDRNTDAEACYRKALLIRESKEGKESASSASDYLYLGDVLCDMGQYKEAEGNYTIALRIYRRSSKIDDPVLGVCHQHLAAMFYRWRKLASAGKYYDEAVRIYTKNLPATKKNLANLKGEMSDFPIEAYSQACEEWREFVSKNVANRITQVGLLRNLYGASKRLGPDGALWAQDVLKQLQIIGAAP